MHMSSIPNHINHMSVLLVLQHLECLPKTQVTHDIERQIITPIRHILRLPPSLLSSVLPQFLTKRPHIPQNILLHTPHRTVRKCMR